MVWGQVDSVGVVFLLLAVRELWRDRTERSAIFTVVAAIIKPQLGILVPIVAAVTIRRALWPGGGYGEDRPPETRMSLRWERETRGPVRILTTGVAGLVTAVGLSAGFGLSILDLLRQVLEVERPIPTTLGEASQRTRLMQRPSVIVLIIKLLSTARHGALLSQAYRRTHEMTRAHVQSAVARLYAICDPGLALTAEGI